MTPLPLDGGELLKPSTAAAVLRFCKPQDIAGFVCGRASDDSVDLRFIVAGHSVQARCFGSMTEVLVDRVKKQVAKLACGETLP